MRENKLADLSMLFAVNALELTSSNMIFAKPLAIIPLLWYNKSMLKPCFSDGIIDTILITLFKRTS